MTLSELYAEASRKLYKAFKRGDLKSYGLALGTHILYELVEDDNNPARYNFETLASMNSTSEKSIRRAIGTMISKEILNSEGPKNAKQLTIFNRDTDSAFSLDKAGTKYEHVNEETQTNSNTCDDNHLDILGTKLNCIDKDRNKDKEKKESNKRKKPKQTTEDIDSLRPPGLTDKAWDGFKKLRKKKRADITEFVINGFIKKCAEFNLTLQEGMEEWLFTQHQGFYPDKKKKKAERYSETDYGQGINDDRSF